jgi:hypothetical protein
MKSLITLTTLLAFVFACCVLVSQSTHHLSPIYLIGSRGRHGDDRHAESRFKRAQSLMGVALKKAQRFDTKANIQESQAKEDEKIHDELIHEADLASRTLAKERDHARKIELLRYLSLCKSVSFGCVSSP